MIARPIATTAVLLGALALVGAVAPAAGQDGEGMTVLGAGFTGLPFALAGDVVVETDGIWCCLRDYGDPALPGWLAWYQGGAAGGLWREVLYEDGFAAILRDDFDAGVLFLDLADAAAPTVLGAITGTTYLSGHLHERLLFLALESLVIVYDVSLPASPTFRFATTTPARTTSRSFCSIDDLAYFIEGDATVHVLGIGDPLAIADLGTFDLAGDRVDALAASPGVLHALVTTETAPEHCRLELVTLDLADPAAPVETDRQFLTEGPGARGRRLQRRDQLLLAAENQATTHAFDLTVPTQPVPGFTLPVAAEHLAITATRLLAYAGEELRIHTRTAADEQPALLSVRHRLPSLRRLSGCGPVLLAQPEKDRSLLIAVDATDPAHPRLTSEFETGLDGAFVHHDDVAVMVAGDDLQLVDVSDPAAPILGGTLRLTSRVNGMGAALASRFLALEVDAMAAVILVDIADLNAPRQAARLEGCDLPLAAAGNVLLVAMNDQTAILEVSDPEHPVNHGLLPLTGQPVAAAIAGPRAYCLTEQAGIYRLQVVDIADPAAASVIAVQILDHPGALTIQGQRLHVVSSNRVQILDIAHPGPPTPVAWLAPAFSPSGRLGTHDDLVITGTNLTVARDDGWRPIAVALETTPSATRLVSAHPNPFNPRTTITFHLATPTHATLTVHDLRGRLVATLANEAMPPGPHQVPWKGTDDGGHPLPSGIYLVHLATPTATAAATITLVK